MMATDQLLRDVDALVADAAQRFGLAAALDLREYS